MVALERPAAADLAAMFLFGLHVALPVSRTLAPRPKPWASANRRAPVGSFSADIVKHNFTVY
jgi:hypothetical protein